MARGQDMVLAGVDQRCLLFSKASPEEKYQAFFFRREFADHGIGEIFPSFVLVTAGLFCAYCENCIEQQYSLFRPATKVPGFWIRDTQVLFYFPENIHQGRRGFDSVGN